MYLCSLKTDWQLRHEELYFDRDYYATVLGRQDGWLDVETLPCDVHVPLIAAGVIADPVVADNCFKCEWIEGKSWWFKKTFNVGEELLNSANSELVVDGLDVKADLFLNGLYLGHHPSAMYPFRKDVRDLLHAGENLLVARVTSGLEYFSELDRAKIKDHISSEAWLGPVPRGDGRRVFVRKPQYVYGWDWSPRIATCGIMGDARIEAYDEIAIRNVKFTTERLTAEAAHIRVEAEIENLHPINTLDATVELDIRFKGALVRSAEKDVFMKSGLNYVEFELSIDKPMPWWPNGMGEQNLYDVTVCARTSSDRVECRRLTAGIRTVRLNMDRVASAGRMFTFEINGVRTFCKGGNWETPDSIYGRVTDQKYEQLVQEAQAAHFNMFRMNGVNAYERDYFYDCCDRYGILIWQDFDFSCAAYPDDLEWFQHEVDKEVEYQTRRLASHPCIVLWCGNNECQLMMIEGYRRNYWAGDKKPASPGGTLLYNEIMPRITRRNSPEIPYWNSSPYGGVGDLESNAYGDRHHWDCFMNDDIDKRIVPEEYDKIACKFVSEFGCVGPTKKSSVYKYYGSDVVDMDSAIWGLHTNTFEKNTIKAALRKHYVDPETLSLDEYLLYAGLFQGVMLGYALESMRCAANNYGALIWSYNDAWGEVGWSIVDYYLTRKIAYYFVKRALAPRKLILRENAGAVDVLCTNDSREALTFELECGYVGFEGSRRNTDVKTVSVEAGCKGAVVARMQKGAHDVLRGVYYARAADSCGITPATLRAADFRSLFVPRPTLTITEANATAGKIAFIVSSDTYAHAVHFGLDGDVRLSDDYFDLLPGEAREVTVEPGNAPLAVAKIRPACISCRAGTCLET